MFEYLIEDFKTYKPLLSAIKTEYELYISHLQEKTASLEPLTVSLSLSPSPPPSLSVSLDALSIGRDGGGSWGV